MKKLILLFIFGLLVSCREPVDNGNNYIDGPTRFIVTDIISDKSLMNMNIYYVEIVDLNGFSSTNNGNNETIKFTDVKGKFFLGQVINFDQLK
jgi:hypothetical protein